MGVENSVLEGSQVASQLRASGHTTLLDAQPAMRSRFIELRNQGRTFRSIRKTLCEEFPAPDYHVPSRVQLQAYIRNRLQVPVVIEPYTPDYNKQLRKLDPMLEMARVVGEAKKQYERAVSGRTTLLTQSKLLMNYSKVLLDYQTMLDRSGIARRAGADNIATQNHLHLHQHQEIVVNEEASGKTSERLLAAFERLRSQAADIAKQ